MSSIKHFLYIPFAFVADANGFIVCLANFSNCFHCAFVLVPDHKTKVSPDFFQVSSIFSSIYSLIESTAYETHIK